MEEARSKGELAKKLAIAAVVIGSFCVAIGVLVNIFGG